MPLTVNDNDPRPLHLKLSLKRRRKRERSTESNSTPEPHFEKESQDEPPARSNFRRSREGAAKVSSPAFRGLKPRESREKSAPCLQALRSGPRHPWLGSFYRHPWRTLRPTATTAIHGLRCLRPALWPPAASRPSGRGHPWPRPAGGIHAAVRPRLGGHPWPPYSSPLPRCRAGPVCSQLGVAARPAAEPPRRNARREAKAAEYEPAEMNSAGAGWAISLASPMPRAPRSKLAAKTPPARAGLYNFDDLSLTGSRSRRLIIGRINSARAGLSSNKGVMP